MKDRRLSRYTTETKPLQDRRLKHTEGTLVEED